MPLDISIVRTYRGGDPEKVRESQRRRFADVALVDKVIAEDEEWRRLVALADDAINRSPHAAAFPALRESLFTKVKVALARRRQEEVVLRREEKAERHRPARPKILWP